MSGNSCWSPLQTAPIVSDLACLGGFAFGWFARPGGGVVGHGHLSAPGR